MRAAFHTLGCKTNSYETQAVTEQFEAAGFETVDFADAADVYVVNTCSVTAEAARKSRQMLHRCKGKNPEAVVAACGCFAQEVKEELLADGAVDLVVGNNEKSHILDLVCELIGKKSKESSVLVDDLMHCGDYERQLITGAGDHVRAYVKIQDGCNRFCSYCIIPYLRGRSRSRSVPEIIEEIKGLADRGIKEIVFTGIDISDFHEDGKEAEQKSSGEALADLIFAAEEIRAIERIRLGSLEAGIISEDFVKAAADSKKLCPHFHLSLQSGCDETLRRMNRQYTAEEFLQSVDLLRSYFQDPAVTTDVIAGFAGESREEFEETKRFLRKAAFSEIHVFPYSRRRGTRADRMPGQLTRAEKADRAAELIAIGREMQLAYMERFLNRPVQVLTEEIVRIGEQPFLIGFTPQYVKVAVPFGQAAVNEIVTVIPTETAWLRKEPILK